MVKTLIVLGLEENCPILHKAEGLAKNLRVAQWLFEFCGWKTKGYYPELTHIEITIDWPEGSLIFPCDMTQLWVLGDCMYLN